MSQPIKVYQKREIVLLDIHCKIEKKHIDDALKEKYQLTDSKLESNLNVEFKSANIAREVYQFLHNKDLSYNHLKFKISLKGNRFLIDGLRQMKDIKFEEIKSFFSNYGEVNNVYFTKKYFATLATINQAIDLVEKVRFLQIDNTRIEIKYAFDRNVGNRHFEVKQNNQNHKTGESKSFEVKSKRNNNNNKPTILLGETNTQSEPTIQLGYAGASGDRLNGSNDGNKKKSNLNGSRVNLNDSYNGSGVNKKKSNLNGSRVNLNDSYNGSGVSFGFFSGNENDQSNNNNSSNGAFIVKDQARKKVYNRNNQANSNQQQPTTIPKTALLANPPQQQQQTSINQPKPNIASKNITKVFNEQNINGNSPKQSNTPLFASGPPPSASSSNQIGNFKSLNSLNYNNPNFMPIDYLENKKTSKASGIEQIHTTTTYYSKKPETNSSSLGFSYSDFVSAKSSDSFNVVQAPEAASFFSGNTSTTTKRSDTINSTTIPKQSPINQQSSATNSTKSATKLNTIPNPRVNHFPDRKPTPPPKVDEFKDKNNCVIC